MSLSLAHADETTKVTFTLVYQDPAEGGPEDAPERELDFASEEEAKTWVDERCIVPLRINRVERVYNRWGSIVFTYTRPTRYDPVRGY